MIAIMLLLLAACPGVLQFDGKEHVCFPRDWGMDDIPTLCTVPCPGNEPCPVPGCLVNHVHERPDAGILWAEMPMCTPLKLTDGCVLTYREKFKCFECMSQIAREGR